MDQLALSVDAAWVAGLLLALCRTAAFVVASPLVPATITVPGRLAVALALALALATPVAAAPTLGLLVGGVAVNVAVGLALAIVTGVLVHLFAFAGALVDLGSGLSVSGVFDPTTGEQTAVHGRLFQLMAVALLYLLGGVQAIVRGLAASVAAVPLDGGVTPDPGLLGLATRLLARLVVAGIQLALPVVAALFLAEVVLGLAARFSPQANVFLLGLPAKLLLTMTVTAGALTMFPATTTSLVTSLGETAAQALRFLTAS